MFWMCSHGKQTKVADKKHYTFRRILILNIKNSIWFKQLTVKSTPMVFKKLHCSCWYWCMGKVHPFLIQIFAKNETELSAE